MRLESLKHSNSFVFSACPIIDSIEDAALPMPIPTADCFEKNKLKFVSDELYGAPVDELYPERAYIAPASNAEWTAGEPGELSVYGALYKMKFRLPRGLHGHVVLLNWYYLTANSCKHEGYLNYTFPSDWETGGIELLPDCGVVPPDGDGVPEQVSAKRRVLSIAQTIHGILIRSPNLPVSSFGTGEFTVLRLDQVTA